MIRLADVIHGRNNNFHLLRMIAASAVLLSHSYPLATGDRRDEPLRAAFGCTFGSIAVDLFFLVSGMLVTMSLVQRGSALDFAKARILRIWPGLAATVLLAVFVLGPALTTQPLAQYFSARETLMYAAHNLVLLKGVAYTLPGVLATNPWPDAVNGSLWTLPWELKCYIALVLVWLALRRTGQSAHFTRVAACVWVALLGWFAWSLRSGTLEDALPRLWLMFCSGALLCLLKERIVLSATGAIAAAAAVALAAGHGMAFGIVYVLALPYLMLCAAYLPRGIVLQYNRLGDYSYGMYIYAYPVQQTLMHFWPGLRPLALFVAALAATGALAVLSWHCLEKPALRLVRSRRPAAATAAVAAPRP